MPNDDKNKKGHNEVETDLEAAQKQIQEALGQSVQETPADEAPEAPEAPVQEQPDKAAIEQEIEDVDLLQSASEKELFKEEKDNSEEENDDSSKKESSVVDTVTVQPVDFMSFDNDVNPKGADNKNLEILMDIKLELSVELGRCKLPIKKILELTRDSIIELDKVAGEPVSLFANGKHIANGEIVVIEDNFALRITSIIEPEKRLKSLD